MSSLSSAQVPEETAEAVARLAEIRAELQNTYIEIIQELRERLLSDQAKTAGAARLRDINSMLPWRELGPETQKVERAAAGHVIKAALDFCAVAKRRSHHAPEPDSVGMQQFARAAVDAAYPAIRKQRDEELRERLEAKFGGSNLSRALSIFEEADDAQ